MENHPTLAGLVIKGPRHAVDVLQLFNPLAPASFGNPPVTYYERGATVPAGAGPARRAVSDYGPLEANGLVFSRSW